MCNEKNKIYHLQFIQNLIERMSTTSTIIKGFAVTISVGLCSLITTNILSFGVRILLIIPLIAFLLLDTYYLYLEKSYRSFYDEIRNGNLTADFSMSLPNIKKTSYLNCMKSISIWGFYIFIIMMYLLICITKK